MADVLTIDDLIADKKHSTFFAEVVTGKAGGVVSGADIANSTNQVTGQVQKTLPQVLADLGMVVQTWTATSGGTLTNAAQVFLNDKVGSVGIGNYYAWSGTFPKVVTAGLDPAITAGFIQRSDAGLREDLAAQNSQVLISGVVAEKVVELNRTAPKYTANLIYEYLNSMCVSVFEYAHLITVKGDVNNPATWDFAPAIQAALNSGFGNVLIPYGIIGLGSQVVIPSDVTIICKGKIKILNSIVQAAIIVDGKSGVNIEELHMDASAVSDYAGNLLLVQNCSDCEFHKIRMKDSPNHRYPLSPVRSINNTRCDWSDFRATNVADMGFQTYQDTYCTYDKIQSFDGTLTAIETNNGNHNIYTNLTAYCPLNTTTSAIGFNDQKSTLDVYRTVGGAYGCTIGHSGVTADYSNVHGGQIDSPVYIGLNVQAMLNGIVSGNKVSNVTWYTDTTSGDGVRVASDTARTIIAENQIISCQHGIRAANYSLVALNQIYGCTRPFRPMADNTPGLYVGNMAGNAAGRPAYEFNSSVFAKYTSLVGNMSYDDRATPLQTYGFDTVAGVQMIGCADYGSLTAAFNGTGERILNMDLKKTGSYRVIVPLTDGASYTTVTNDHITARSIITMSLSAGAWARNPYFNAQNVGSVQIGHTTGTGGTVTLWITTE